MAGGEVIEALGDTASFVVPVVVVRNAVVVVAAAPVVHTAVDIVDITDMVQPGPVGIGDTVVDPVVVGGTPVGLVGVGVGVGILVGVAAVSVAGHIDDVLAAAVVAGAADPMYTGSTVSGSAASSVEKAVGPQPRGS